MKRILLPLLIPILLLSFTNYYYVTIVEDTPVYQVRNENTSSILVIPKNQDVYITKKGKYRKVKYNSYTGYAVNPVYIPATRPYSSSTPSTGYKRSSRGPSSNTSSSPKTVRVKGYTRKDGTYVRPHTRSAPRRKS